MLTLAALRELLCQTALGVWPTLSAAELLRRIEFCPLLDLGLGDLGTNLPFLVAEQLRIDPQQIAAVLISKIDGAEHASFVAQRGYLNFRGYIDLSELETCATNRNFRIFVPNFGKTMASWEQARLLAAAFLQSALLNSYGAGVMLQVGGETISLTSSHSCSGATFRSALKILLAAIERSDRSVLRESLDFAALVEDYERTFVWLTPAALEESAFKDFSARFQAGKGRPKIVCVEGSWIAGIEERMTLEQLLEWSDHDLESLILYLSSDFRAAELDIGVARFAEKSNILWYLHVSLARLQRFAAPPLAGVAVTLPYFDDGHPLRMLASRLSYLQLFFQRAACHAAVPEACRALRELLESLNLFFNTPQNRTKLASQSLPELELQILSSASNILSAIIKRCNIFRNGTEY